MARILFVLVLLVTVVSTPQAPIRVVTGFGVGFAPASFQMRVTIPPHPDNRHACLTYDSGDYYRRSCWQVDEDSAPSTWIWARDVPAGEYLAVADLTRTTRTIRSVPVPFRVLPRH
jgi:hypothetical protein